MKITDYLHLQYIEIGIDVQSKEALIDRMIQIVARNPKVQNTHKVRSAIFEREKILSTGIGDGLAVPHAKSDAVDGIVMAFGVCKEPVDYHSLDGSPVHLVLLLVRRENETRLGLSLLSRASKILKSESVRDALLDAKTREEVFDIFLAAEETLEHALVS
jgi:mannitol/fructose-specific phosphotransferase system IIA component (Ntr-type)